MQVCTLYKDFQNKPVAAGVLPATSSFTAGCFSHDNKYIIYTCQQTNAKSYPKTACSHSISNNGSPCSEIKKQMYSRDKLKKKAMKTNKPEIWDNYKKNQKQRQQSSQAYKKEFL